MRHSIFAVVLLSALVVGCQGPVMNGGFYQSPYMAPGVDGPGPGVIPGPGAPGPGAPGPGHFQPVSSAMPMPGMMPMSATSPRQPAFFPTSQIHFVGVESLVINFDATQPATFDSAPLVCPATHDFPQGNIYRLKVSNIPGQPGKELFPTLEVAPTAARTQAFLAHSSVPIEFSVTDFDQVFSGNYITKVIYLPNPEFQGIAMSAVGTLVNTQLQPGVDPIVEASKRGAILAVIRMGNKDLSSIVAERQHFAAQNAFMQNGQMYYPTGPMIAGGGGTIPQHAIAGVNIPPYGVPMTKTTTGVPGPPQLPQDMHYMPNRSPVLRTEPIPAPPVPRTFTMPGQPIPNPYAPPVAVQPGAPIQQ